MDCEIVNTCGIHAVDCPIVFIAHVDHSGCDGRLQLLPCTRPVSDSHLLLHHCVHRSEHHHRFHWTLLLSHQPLQSHVQLIHCALK